MCVFLGYLYDKLKSMHIIFLISQSFPASLTIALNGYIDCGSHEGVIFQSEKKIFSTLIALLIYYISL